MKPPDKACEHCVHTKSQHDEDGFCEQEMTETNEFCPCPGYDEKEETQS